MKKILTLTMNPTIDKSTSVEHVIADKKLRCKTPLYEPGGGGINVSRVIKRLGGKSVIYYICGGPYGKMLKKLLDKEKLDHHPIPIKDLTRENLMVLDEKGNQQYRFGMPGPKLEKQEWEKCLNIIKHISPLPDYIIASGSLPPNVPEDFYARLVKICKQINTKIIIDTWGKALLRAAEEGPFLLKPNMNELCDLMGEKIQDESHQEEAAGKLRKKYGVKVVVVSLGAAGALLVTDKKMKRIRSPSVPIKSRVGAGDSMVAGIVLSLARGKSLYKAVCFGVAAGAAAAMTPGTQLCRKEDTEKLYKTLKSENK